MWRSSLGSAHLTWSSGTARLWKPLSVRFKPYTQRPRLLQFGRLAAGGMAAGEAAERAYAG